MLADDLEPGEIDARVRELTGRGESLYRLDEATLAELEPDLIVTQALCAVCAVSYDDVRAIAGRLPSAPRVLSLDPETLEDVLGDLTRLAWATGNPRLGERLLRELRTRLAAVASAVADAGAGPGERPRVAALEWLDPVYAGGHWVPEMIAAAGGVDVLGEAGRRSRVVDWDELAAARPELVVLMPCGLYAAEAAAQGRDHAESPGRAGRRPHRRRRRRLLVLAPGPAARRRGRAARAPAPSGGGAGAGRDRPRGAR